MATKLRKLGTSAITKAILWVVFSAFCYCTILGCVTVYHTADKGNLPSESLTTFEYTDSQQFMLHKRDIIAALYWNYPPEKLYGYDKAPTLYYRAEREDGSVTTNVTDADADWFKKHRAYGIYQSGYDGDWETLALSGERRQMGSNPIQYDQVQIFSDTQYGYSGSYRSNGYDNCLDKTYMLPMPQDVPEAVLRYIYGENYYESDVRYSSGGVTVHSRTNLPTGVAQEPDYQNNVDTEYNDPEQADENFSDEEIYQAWLREHPIPQATVYYAFDDGSLADYESFWNQSREYYVAQFVLIGGLALAALASAIWLLAVCGRRPADRELHLWWIDRLWSEAILGVGFFTVLGFFALFFVGMEAMLHGNMYEDSVLLNLYCMGLVVLAILVLVLLLALMRLIKARMLLRNSLTFKLLSPCWALAMRCVDAFRSCFDERSFKGTPLTKALQRRQMVFFGVLGTLLLFLMVVSLAYSKVLLVLLLLCTAALAVIAYWHIKGNRKTYLEINAGFNESFEEQMKSERTKTALITNVSHDLKTPLTSIITYVDLLSKEDLSDTARDYVTVLAQKSERLKSIVADLFDLSKSASGNIPLEMESLDLKRLIEQTLADMRDSIDGSELTLKVKLPEEEVNIYSDGKKLYRVFQNILDNALKYSMTGTRVFITLDVEGSMAVATVKNTAAYEMDFTAEEVLQRFSRGDKSRTGDGSGLGLSIAESFTRACGGDFKVELDGDLFKVTISFREQ